MTAWRRTRQGAGLVGMCVAAAVRVVVTVGTAAVVLLLTLPTSPAAADSCPNAAFRTGPSANLPDCRAYELASPPFKFGLPANPGFLTVLDGSHVAMVSRGAFAEAGADHGTLGAEYILGRSEPAGWGATAVNLPASEFFGAGHGLLGAGELVDVSRDFGRGLIASVPIGSTPGSIESKPVNLHFYIREPNPSGAPCSARAIQSAGVCLVEVGPAVPPATVAAWTESEFGTEAQTPEILYRGASHDLGHVFFSQIAPGSGQTSWLWPGDETVAFRSLYEFSGVGTTPRLVGLSGGPEPHLISQCGTDLGSFESKNTYNAIAREGSVVLFTARAGGCENRGHVGTGPKVNELYARIGGSATVAISEPSLLVPGRDCTAVCREDENEENGHERSEGIFVGASEDGSKVFFLTEQPLLNSDTNTTKDLYEAELEGGAVKKLIQVSHNDVNPGEAAEVQGVLRTSKEGTRVYFVAHGVLAANQDAKGERAVAGADNLYVYEPDPATPGQFKTVFIASLSESDKSDWGAGRGGGSSGFVELTPRTPTASDGRFLLFTSRSDATPDARGEGDQLYRFDADEQKLVRVSIGENGFNDNEEGAEFAIEPHPSGLRSLAGPQGVAISNDGAYVFFLSRTGLTPTALQKQVVGCGREKEGICTEPLDAQNVYEYHEGHVYLISDGQDRQVVEKGSAVQLIGASASGQDVYFTTADQLVGQDTDTQVDVYDARIGGGFPAPTLRASCQPEACHGPPAAAPGLPAAGSATFSGPGNLAPILTVSPQRKSRPLTRAQKLANALKACRRKPKRERRACVRRAHRMYGARSHGARRHRPTHSGRRAGR
jgi:hypothetical protein